MHDATSRRHPIHSAGPDWYLSTKAVAVDYFAVEQIRDGSEVDVRMWSDINTLSDAELGRPHLVEENEGADRLPHPRRQRTANLEAAKIAGAGYNHCFYCIGHVPVAVRRIRTGLPTHVALFLSNPGRFRCSAVEIAGVHLSDIQRFPPPRSNQTQRSSHPCFSSKLVMWLS